MKVLGTLSGFILFFLYLFIVVVVAVNVTHYSLSWCLITA